VTWIRKTVEAIFSAVLIYSLMVKSKHDLRLRKALIPRSWIDA
jgi:hypothetical protein